MSTLLANVLNLGLVVVEFVLVVGLFLALGRIALGHRDGYRTLLGVGIAMVLIGMWSSGRLSDAVHQVVLMSETPTSSGPISPGSLALGTGR